MTDRSVRPMTVGRTRIRFFASRYVAQAGVSDIKTPTGTMRVSTPETTAVDLVRFVKAAGHLDYVATVIAELAAKLDPRRLKKAVALASDVPNAQRLGFILDLIRASKLAGPLHAWVERQEPNLVPLRSGRPVVGVREDRRWHLLVNGPIEVEA